MLKFDEALKLSGDGGVDAKGPLGPHDELVELCAWVFQQSDPTGDTAAATEMGVLETHHGGDHGTGDHVQIVEEGGQRKWRLQLAAVGGSTARLVAGEAFGVAVAMFRNEGGTDQVMWWGHPVQLEEARPHGR
jgi:hypothetical protein